MTSPDENAPSETPRTGRNVFVLGGGGFIGSHLCHALVANGFAVRVLERSHRADARRLLPPSVEVVEADFMSEPSASRAVGDADTVVHLIHTTVPGSSMRDPVYDVTSNVAASAAWLKSLKGTAVRRIVYVSSGGTVYGVPRAVPIEEDHPTDPVSSYGITKLAIEKYVAMYATSFGLDYVILRPSNVYGPGQRLGIGQGVIGVLVDRALRGMDVEIWGTGKSVRDYLFVDDLVAAMSAVLDHDAPSGVFNVSSGVGHTVLDILEIVERELGTRLAVNYLPDRGFDVPVNVLSPAALERATGWRARVDLEDGIARTLEWLTTRRGS